MNVLQSLSQRNGQWYYLSSMANMGLGNNVNALSDIREAVRLEPDNMHVSDASSANGRGRAGTGKCRILLEVCRPAEMITA